MTRSGGEMNTVNFTGILSIPISRARSSSIAYTASIEETFSAGGGPFQMLTRRYPSMS